MNEYQLEMAVGIRAAAKLTALKSKLRESVTVAMQTQDFDGAVPSIGALDNCPHCGVPHYEGVMHQ